MSGAVNRAASQAIAKDSAWFSGELEKRFRTHIRPQSELGAVERQEEEGRRQLEFENLDKQRAQIRIGTAVLTVAGALVCSSVGMLPLVVTMGVGTGSALLSEQIFRGKIEKQRESVRAAIQVNVPELVDSAVGESEGRLRAVYDSMLEQAQEQEKLWVQAQNDALDRSSGGDEGAMKETDELLAALRALTEQLHRA